MAVRHGQLDRPGGHNIRMKVNSFPLNRAGLKGNPAIEKAIGRERFPVYSAYRGESHASAIPDAVLSQLGDKRHLGIHTEMFADGVMELFESGVITNEKKTLHPGKIVSSFLMGSRELYDFVDNNPCVEMHPSHYVNDPFIIAKNDNMISINSAISIDLTGQVNSDSMGTRFYSGIGGQVHPLPHAHRLDVGSVVPDTILR